MIVGIICLAVGALLFWIGFSHWRYRNQETVGILEAAILRAADEEPLPLTKIDWFLKYLQAILGFTLGPIFAFLGIVIILSELDLL